MENTNEVKKQIDLSNRLFAIVAGTVSIIVLLAVINSYNTYKQKTGRIPKEITVSAEGKVFAVPDIALINFGVESEAKTPEAAIKDNTEKMNGILTELKSLGIDAKDIQTTNYNLYPRYEYQNKTNERIFKGYVLSQNINVKIRDFTKAGSAMEKAVTKGANLVGNLNFSVEDADKYKQEAKKIAIDKAKAKAVEISKQTGMEMGKIVNISEGDYYYPAPRMMAQESFSMMKAGVGGAAPELSAGTEEVRITVNLTYLAE